jgi:hypothetical protein
VLVARLLHSLHAEDLSVQFQLLQTAQEQLMRSGPRRAKYTLPALGFEGLALLRRLTSKADAGSGDGGLTCDALLQWLLRVALALAEVPEPLLALRLMLVTAQAASEEAGSELLAYEFMEQVSYQKSYDQRRCISQ